MPTRKLRTIIRKDRRKITSPINGKQGGRPSGPAPLSAALDFIHENHAFPSERKGVDDQTSLIHWRGNWYTFNGDGWATESNEDIQKEMMAWMHLKTDYGSCVSRQYMGNVLDHMKANSVCGLSGRVNLPTWISTNRSAKNWVGFSNGVAVNVWDLSRGLSRRRCVRKLTPDLFTKDVVKYEYNPKAKCPRWMNFLNTSLPDKKTQRMFQEMFGLLLADTCKYEVFWYLYGPTSRNGKTLSLNVAAVMVGKQNVSHVSLTALDDKFETWPLAEAKINVCGDMPTDIKRSSLAQIEGQFKDLISGANIEYQKKGKDKFNAPCRARFIFAGNSLPTFVDRSDAIWERLRVIYFPVQIPQSKRDPNLAEKIIRREMPGVFNWAVKGLSRVLQQGGATETDEAKEVKHGHRMESDHEQKFIVDMGYVRGRQQEFVVMTQMYEMYKSWMEKNGYNYRGSGKFYHRVETLIHGVKRMQKRMKGIKFPVKVFVGLTTKGRNNRKRKVMAGKRKIKRNIISK